MTTETAAWLEPLTYWLRIEDLVSEPRIGLRLVNQASEGQLLLKSGHSLAGWIDESEALLQCIDSELCHTTGSDYLQLVDIVLSMPPVESLRSMLTVASRQEAMS